MNWKCDELLDHKKPFFIKKNDLLDSKFMAIKESFIFHYKNCNLYNNYCKTQDFKPNKLKKFSDLKNIPLLSIQIFKEDPNYLLSVPKENISLIAKSSGTSGKPSQVPKDKITLDRAVKSLTTSLRQVLGMDSSFVGILAPPPQVIPTWFAYYMSMAKKYYEKTSFYVKDGILSPQEIVSKLEDEECRPRNLIGPPFAFLSLVQYMTKSGHKIQLDERSVVSTGGGWKSRSGESISRDDLDEKISECFGVSKTKIRDGLNSVEFNTLLLDCEYKHKHVPPWLYVSIRDPKNPDEVVSTGEDGLMAYLDPLANSYPSFVLTDDIGKIIDQEECECGRTGQTIEWLRRAKGAESRGCALKMEEFTEVIK